MEITLPDGIHIETVSGREAATNLERELTILWADRPYDRCPRCGTDDVDVSPPCPAIWVGEPDMLVGPRDQRHGCGEWLGVDWAEVEAPTAEVAMTIAEALAARREVAVAKRNARIEAGLKNGLRAALTRLRQPLDAGETPDDREAEVTTGSDVDPGVCEMEGVWVAWAYSTVSGALITVTEADL